MLYNEPNYAAYNNTATATVLHIESILNTFK